MSLVAVVLLVLVVVALGMRSMNRRESSLPPERLKEMAEKEESKPTRSTDEFANHEPRMTNFSPDFSPIDEVKPKPVRTGQRGRRGVDEWGNPTTDVEDEEFWANIRSDAEEGGFGADGTVAARKGASRPVDRPVGAPRPAEAERTGEPRAPKARPATAADPNAATMQVPLPQRPTPAAAPAPAAASAGLADLVEPAPRPAPSASDLANQRTVTFTKPPADILSALGAQAAAPAAPAAPSAPSPRRPDPMPATGMFAAATGGSAAPAGAGSATPVGAGTTAPVGAGSGAFPATGPASSGNFPLSAPTAPISSAPTSDAFPAYGSGPGARDAAWTPSGQATPAATTSGSWPASPDILDDPAPTPSYNGPSGSWPAFETPASRSSYEVRAGWAVADSDPVTGPSPATGVPTAPGRTVTPYDDVLAAPAPGGSAAPSPAGAPSSFGAYETGDYAAPAAPAWPEPPAADWPAYGQQPASGAQGATGGQRRPGDPDYGDYYR
ncbi:hypothetical protein AB0L05_37225 [Nonomuraea pusilla]|uniref:hypothetical protein n=1 Tax=Nonomuraea pusilla TaxID=46177 RepID=UPI003321090C